MCVFITKFVFSWWNYYTMGVISSRLRLSCVEIWFVLLSWSWKLCAMFEFSSSLISDNITLCLFYFIFYLRILFVGYLMASNCCRFTSLASVIIPGDLIPLLLRLAESFVMLLIILFYSLLYCWFTMASLLLLLI